MSEDYYDVVFLNEDTAILYGRHADGCNFYRPLLSEEAERLYEIERRYAAEREQVLRYLAQESA